jgi:SAM-dependent methyltransferase
MPTNQALRGLYERVYAGGKEQFFTFHTADITREVLAQANAAGSRVLEVGCGTGETAALLCEAGATVLAVDYAPAAIAEAQRRHQHPNLRFEVGSFDQVTGEFDLIVAQEIIEHSDDPKQFLSALVDRLTPTGYLIVTCPSFANLRGVVWMTLQVLLNVPMSLTDRHFLCPFDMERMAAELGLACEWRTFRHSQAHGEQMVIDLRKRLTNALRDAGLDNSRVESLLEWLSAIAAYERDAAHNGAKAIYTLRRAPEWSGA